MTTELIWQSLEEPGWEHVRVAADHPEWTVFDSIFVREHDGEVRRGGYTLVVDKAWRTLELRLMLETSPGVMDAIHLLADGEGNWADADQQPIPELQGCIDVDIQWTPLTNSLPINRLGSDAGEEREIRVVYIGLPEGRVRPIMQRYRHIDGGSWRYETDTRPHARELLVDDDGYVVSYPELFVRT